MPYTISWSPGLISLLFSGHVTGQDIIDVLLGVREDERYCDDLDQIWDCNGITTSAVGWKDLQAIRSLVKQMIPAEAEGRVAIITASNLTYSSALAMIAMTKKPGRQRRKVFRNIEAARTWLNLPSPTEPSNIKE